MTIKAHLSSWSDSDQAMLSLKIKNLHNLPHSDTRMLSGPCQSLT